MTYKNSTAPRNTITRDLVDLEGEQTNVYETLVVMSKRANQIGLEIREELNAKLQEFATHTDNLEEIFENREQIEISKFYEKLPKPVSIAVDEFLEDKIHIRRIEKVEAPAVIESDKD